MTEDIDQVYVSITGLTLKSPFHGLRFSWHATRSYSQAAGAPGNLATDAKRVDGVHHTLTVWTSRDAMLDYLRTGSHLAAMKAYRSIGMGKVHGYYAMQAPSWEDALAIWHREGRDV
jgi:heme-degrading monooxygenase HmoA